MFAVVWVGAAFDRMGQIIRNNPARKDEPAEALGELSAHLRTHADTAGESREGRLRVTIAGPLVLFFTADAESRTATIVRVRSRFTA